MKFYSGFEDVGQERRPGRGDLPQGRTSLQESERSHREADFYRNGMRTRTSATIRCWIKPAAGSKGPTSHSLRMPCSGRACRSESEQFCGSLGTIFIARSRLRATPAARPPILVVLARVCAGTYLSDESGATTSRSLCRQLNFSLHFLKLAKLQRQATQR